MGDQLLDSGSETHVLCISHHGYGHLTPFLRFCKDIAQKGITISFVCYDNEIKQITSKESLPELQRLGFQFISLQRTGEDVHSPHRTALLLEQAFKPVMAKLLNDKVSGISGPTSIISDMFFTWTQDAADQLQIPRYVFIPSGGLLAKFFQGSVELLENGTFRISETEDKFIEFEGYISIRGLPRLTYHELPGTTRIEAGGFVMRCRGICKAAGVLVNSFDELEPGVLEAWRNFGLENSKVPKIYPVGPIVVNSNTTPNWDLVRVSEDSGSRSLIWLESQPPSSVLYIAFGSWVKLSPQNIKEVAYGLEASNQRFLWVLPEQDGTTPITDLLPSGFQARVADRGWLCIGWAPQVQILAHSSTGGFLTHAGWNSSLESISMGVPMITFPHYAEQHLNCRYMVDILKIACELKTGVEKIVKRTDVERVVRLLMSESEGQAMRCRAATLKKKAALAVADGGSRWRALQEITSDLVSHAKGTSNVL